MFVSIKVARVEEGLCLWAETTQVEHAHVSLLLESVHKSPQLCAEQHCVSHLQGPDRVKV